MSDGEYPSLLDKLRVVLQDLAQKTIALGAECHILRRHDVSRGLILKMTPSAEQSRAAAANHRELMRWLTVVSPVLSRRGIATQSLAQQIQWLSEPVQLKYFGPAMEPASRTRKAFEEKVRLLIASLDEILTDHESAFRPGKQTVVVYEPFAVRIGCHGDGRWIVETHWQGNRAAETVAAPLTAAEVKRLRAIDLEPGRGESSAAVPEAVEHLARLGYGLFGAIFRASTLALYNRAREQALLDGFRLRLEIDVQDGSLSLIPWELLHDGVRFLGLAGDLALARRMTGAVAGGSVSMSPWPLRMLLTVSSPSDLPKINRDVEHRALEEAIAPLAFMGLLDLDVADDGSMKTLGRLFRAANAEGRPYQIWHFAGHGQYDEASRRGTLAMTTPQGGAHWVGALELASLFAEDRNLRLVVLGACHGADGMAGDRWSAAASPFLMASGVGAVVAMQMSISYRSAGAFIAELYGALASGSGIDEAVAAARRGVFDLPNYVEWLRPVLYVREEVAS
jgi:hypothetical protein